ncbi:MAG: hypothetical protein HC802_14050 [Caldilineaceae bacterium]|nr:hypothetical protein [Caldilineaceae bacterium]
MLDRFLASPVRVAAAVFFSALAFYLLAGWDIGADALDSDTLSMVLQWRLIGNGVVLDHWNLSTPKFLPVVLDGSLFELGGYGAVLARSLLTSALLIALATAFVHRAAGWQASLAAAGLLVTNRATFGSAFGGNSTVLYTTFLLGAALCFLAWPSRRAVIGGLAAALRRESDEVRRLVVPGARGGGVVRGELEAEVLKDCNRIKSLLQWRHSAPAPPSSKPGRSRPIRKISIVGICFPK